MSVKLIWVTPDAESLITYIARVSNPKNQQKQLDSENPEEMISRLISFLIRNKHFSPFEMVNACFEIKTTRAISAQIIRHKSFSFQELSQRYTELNKTNFVYPEIRYKGATNRQSSLSYEEKGYTETKNIAITDIAHTAVDSAYSYYETLLDEGVAPESARMVLPMCSPTTIYMNGTLRSWIHYCAIRTEDHVQKEHRDIALSIENILKEHFPLTWKAINYELTQV